MADKELTGVVSVDLSKEPLPHPQSATIKGIVEAMTVTDEVSYKAAADIITRSDAVVASVESYFEADKNLAFKLHKSICAKINTLAAPWKNVRAVLIPKMTTFRRQQEEKRRAEELRLQREAEKREHEARQEALRIQQEAARAAEELRRAGQMREAKEAQTRAQEQAAEVVNTAQALADIGTVLPATAPMGGPGEARIWGGVVDDILATCRAVGSKQIALEYELPKRGGGTEMVPLLEVNQRVIDYLAKRHGREDINVPGCRGDRGLSLRFSAKDISTAAEHSKVDDTGGW